MGNSQSNFGQELIALAKMSEDDHVETSQRVLKAISEAKELNQLDEAINSKETETEKTLLHFAVETGKIWLVEILLNHQVNLLEADLEGNIPLHTAAFLGNVKMVELLLESFENQGILDQHIDTKNKEGMTALHWAVSRAHFETTSLLIRMGANPDIQNTKQYSAIDMCGRLKLSPRQKMESVIKQSLDERNLNPNKNQPLKLKYLVGLCKVWGLIKKMHPKFVSGYNNREWDEALVQTIPKVEASKTPSDFRVAIGELCSKIGDGNTRTIENRIHSRKIKGGVAHPGPQISWKIYKNHTAVIQANNHESFHQPSLRDQYIKSFCSTFLQAAKSQTQTILFDFRLLQGNSVNSIGGSLSGFTNPTGPFKVILETAFRSILPKVVRLPAFRQRVFSGLAPSRKTGSNVFQSGLNIIEGETLTPFENCPKKNQEWICLINSDTSDSIIDLISSLQAEGLLKIVLEADPVPHDISPDRIPEFSPIINRSNSFTAESLNTTGGIVPSREPGISSLIYQVGDGVTVMIRKHDRVNCDGTLGFSPDEVLAGFSDPQVNIDKCLELDSKDHQKPRGAATTCYLGSTSDHIYSQELFPSKSVRLLGLFRLWNVVQYFAPYKALMDRDWETILYEFIPRVEEAGDALQYHLTIANLVSCLCDSHAYANSKLLKDFFGSYVPPLECRKIDDEATIAHIYEPHNLPQLRVGDRILEIDGIRVASKIKAIAPYISASTPQSHEVKVHQWLLAGARDSKINLKIERYEPASAYNAQRSTEGPMEKSVSIDVRRTLSKNACLNFQVERKWKGQSVPLYGILSETSIGFINCAELSKNAVEQALEAVRKAPALILDLRGQTLGCVYALAPRLTPKKVTVAVTQTPYFLPSAFLSDLEGASIEEKHQLTPSSKWKYQGKIVALINHETMSHAEHSCLYLESCVGPTFIGQVTSGANGNLTNILIEGAIEVGFTGFGILHGSRAQLQRKGIEPDIRVEQTREGLFRDEVLEKAVDFLTNKQTEKIQQ